MKDKIIYITPINATFVRLDIEGLSRYYNVKVNLYDWSAKLLLPIFLLRQLLFLVFHAGSTKAIIISFGGYWSLLPSYLGSIFKVPVYIILNGTDSASLPEIGYGSLRKKWFKKVCEWSYKKCSKLLPVSESLIYTENNYFRNDMTVYQGVRYYFKSLKTPYEVVYNGLDENFWTNEGNQKQPDTYLTVFSTNKEKLKGGDLILNVAKKLPASKFLIVGADKPRDEHVPENVLYLGRKTPEELRALYSKSMYYLQLSVFEGFGCALCEAMLCGCIPIVSNVNMLPEIVGIQSLVLKERNAEKLLDLLNQVKNQDINSDYFIQKVRLEYSLTKRIEKLVSIIESE